MKLGILGRFSKKKSKNSKIDAEKNKIISYLKDLQKLEARLWGIIITDLKSGEELVLEDTNHLVYLTSQEDYKELKKVLELKEVKEFLYDIENIKKDFNILKHKLKEKDELKSLISNFTIKLVDAKNYPKFKNVFLLEKKLHEVLDEQEEKLSELITDLSKIKVDKTNKIEAFTKSLKNIRTILAGHLDNIEYFEKERMGFSNTSNIIYDLIRIFKKKID